MGSGVQTTVDIRKLWINPQINGRTEGYLRADLEDLILSIESRGGIMSPITIAKIPANLLPQAGGMKEMLVAGFRRCFSLLALAEDTGDESWLVGVPAYELKSNSIGDVMLAQLIENYVRKDMNPIDTASHMAYLINEVGMSQKAVGEALGIEASGISHHLALLKLPEDVIDLVRKGQISYSAARQMVRLPMESAELMSVAAELAQRETYTKFKKWVDEQLEEEGDDTEGEGSGDAAEGDRQHSASTSHSVRPKTLETEFLPVLKKELSEAKDANIKAALEIYVDAINFVLHGVDGGVETKLGEFLRPYLEQKAKEKAEELANAKEASDKKYYFAACIKRIRQILNPQNYGEGQTIPTSGQALQEIKSTITSQLKDGVLNFVRKDADKDEAGNKIETATPASFKFTGTPDDLVKEIGTAFSDSVKAAKEAAEKRKLAQKEKEAKDAATGEGKAEPVAAG